MRNRKIIIIYWMSIVSILLSVTTIILFFFRVSPNSVVDSNTFISTLVGLITLTTTFIIGYQIYNAFDIRDKIVEIDSAQERINILENRLSESVFLLQAYMHYKKPKMEVEVLLKFIYAIKYSLGSLHPEGYKWLLEGVEFAMLEIKKEIVGSKEVEALRRVIDEENRIIREHKNFLFIKDNYEPLIAKFYTRLSLIAQGREVSPTCLDEEYSI